MKNWYGAREKQTINQPTSWMPTFVSPEDQRTCLKVVQSNQTERMDRKYQVSNNISKSLDKNKTAEKNKTVSSKDIWSSVFFTDWKN